MSEGLNRTQLLGNLCADPEFKMTSGGAAILKLRIATNESYLDRNKERQERVEYHSCVIFGRRAESLSRLLAKGAQVYVEGSLRTSTYDDREGNKRYKTEVALSNLILCGGRGQRQERSGDEPYPGNANRNTEVDDDDDSIPF